MAMANHPSLQFLQPVLANASGELSRELPREELSEVEGHSKFSLAQNPTGKQLTRPVQMGISVNGQLLEENLLLRTELEKWKHIAQNAKLETAELYVKFGELARDWADTVKQLNAMHEHQKKEFEERIGTLEKTNEQLIKENKKMKKVIEDLSQMKSAFDKQRRILRLGQIGYQLDILVSEYIFPGDDRSSKRARYGVKLKSLKGKIEKMQDQKMQQEAKERLSTLDQEMFEDWFLGIVEDIKKVRVDTAHPDLGTYEEMIKVIKDEFKEDNDKREDVLIALERLKTMYELLNRRFGE